MATVTWTGKDNVSSNKYTFTFSCSGGTNLSQIVGDDANGDEMSLYPFPVPTGTQIRTGFHTYNDVQFHQDIHVGMFNPAIASAEYVDAMEEYIYGEWRFEPGSWEYDEGQYEFWVADPTTGDIFNQSTKTQRQIVLNIRTPSKTVTRDNNDVQHTLTNTSGTRPTLWTVTYTLDAPPTFTLGSMTKDKNYYYANLTTVSVPVSNCSAKYGGDITEAKLTIGNRSTTISGNGTLSMLLTEAGTFTPTVTVKDSRGQTTTKSLPAITVTAYSPPSVAFTPERVNASWAEDEEGTNCIIDLTITYMNSMSSLTQPTVKLLNESTGNWDTQTVTWYTNRALSSAVNWSNYNPASPVHLYGKVTGTFGVTTSYIFEVTAHDGYSDSTPIRVTMPMAYYTVDYRAGGHGVAFGRAATEDAFVVDMVAKFMQDVMVKGVSLPLLFYPVGSYYDTSNANFDPNTEWGGTWEKLEDGRVLIARDSSHTVDGGGETKSYTPAGTVGKHTLTTAEIPAHKHGFTTGDAGKHKHTLGNYKYGSNYCASGNRSGMGQNSDANTTVNTSEVAAHHHTGTTDSNTGGGGAHNHGFTGTAASINVMQPYTPVYRWHRTA